MKRTIEINDTLEERVESAIDSVKTELLDYLEANPDQDELPCLNNDLNYSGAIDEIIDGSVPIYNKELEDNWYLHSYELEKALDDAGLYSAEDLGRLDNDQRMSSAFYCYIQDAVNTWYQDEAQEIFDTWRQEHIFRVLTNEDGDLTVYKKDADLISQCTEIFDSNLKTLIESEIMEDESDLEGLKDHLFSLDLIPKVAFLEQD